MFTFVFGIIMVVVGIAVFLLRNRANTKDGRLMMRIAGPVVVLLGIFGVAASMVTVVGTNKVAIVTQFNKPVDALGAGWHDKAPWQETTELDGTRQTLRFEGAGNDEDDDSDKKTWPCINVKIDNNATACVSGMASWQMRVDSKNKEELEKQKERARQLFLNYRTFSRIIRDYIKPSAQSALQATYANVNPLIPAQNPSYKSLSDEMQREFKGILGAEIDVLFVQITNADWDTKTDEAIALQQDQISKTTQAKEKEKTNEAEARAAAALNTSDGKPVQPPSEGVLQNKCLDIAREQGKDPGPCLQPGYGGILGPQPK